MSYSVFATQIASYSDPWLFGVGAANAKHFKIMITHINLPLDLSTRGTQPNES
jgi:hypothetical protein